MSDARRYAVWPDPRSRSRSLKGSRPSVPHGTNFSIVLTESVFFSVSVTVSVIFYFSVTVIVTVNFNNTAVLLSVRKSLTYGVI